MDINVFSLMMTVSTLTANSDVSAKGLKSWSMEVQVRLTKFVLSRVNR